MHAHHLRRVLDAASDLIKQEEGFRAAPYQCSEGYITIGFGTKLHNRPHCMDETQFCLRVTERSATALLEDVLEQGLDDLLSVEYLVLNTLPIAKVAVLLSMQYQMGTQGLLAFGKMWAALRTGRFLVAETEALDSKWAKQTPARANRHANILGEPV